MQLKDDRPALSGETLSAALRLLELGVYIGETGHEVLRRRLVHRASITARGIQLAPLARLHGPHNTCAFSTVHAPPRENGIT